MSTRELKPPKFIQTKSALINLAEDLSKEPIIAVDTESNSLFAYQEQVCLIQFTSSKGDVLVDPLALDDLSPLAPIFNAPSIEKIFHAAEYDVMCLRRDFDFKFQNIFDTMVAANILGHETLGLGHILEKEYGIKVDKRNQRANWGIRPLPDKLLSYARLDTHYLIPLRSKYKKELEQKNLLPLAYEDFQRLTKVRFENGNHNHKNGADSFWRVKGSHDLTPQQAAVLRELYLYREKVARKTNRPLFKIISDKTLLSIAVQMPTNRENLSRIPGMSKGQMERHGSQILSTVKKGKRATPPNPPKRHHTDREVLRRTDALKHWRKTKAQQMQVTSDVILPRDKLMEIVEKNPKDMQELSKLMKDVPWRLSHFGKEILQTLSAIHE